MKRVIITILLVIILIAGIVIGLYISLTANHSIGGTTEETTESIEQQKYKRAIENLNKGFYEQAYKELETIGSYRDVEVINEQMVYESYVLSAIDSLREKTDTDSSFNISKVTFLAKKTNAEEYPVILIQYSSDNTQNNATNFGYFLFHKKNNQYIFEDSVPTLNMNELDRYDKEYVSDTLTILEIEKLRKNRKEVGQADINRINHVILNEGYHNVTILKKK